MAGDSSSAQRLLQDGKLQEAFAAAVRDLDEDPGNVDALYCKAVAERYLGRHQAALNTLDQLQLASANHARGFQEAGHNFRDLGKVEQARDAYQQAIGLNRALSASWRELSVLHQRLGDTKAASIAEAEYKRLSALPTELVTVASLIEENRLYQAEQLCRSFLQRQPHHVEAMRLLALLGVKLFVYDDAEFLLESCVELDPDYWLARLDYVNILHKRQKFEKALAQAAILRDALPGNHVFDLTFANQCVAVGRFEDALSVYDHVIDEHPDFEQTYLSRGHALKTIGRVTESIESYRSAYRTRSSYGDAYWSLANLKTYRFTDEEISSMRVEVERPETPATDRFQLCFALGKAFEDREQFETSFDFYQRGNALRLTGLRYQPELVERAVDRQIQVCTRQFFEDLSGSGSELADPVFIVGLPRSGSTLLEQILASHSQIDGTMELPNIIATAQRLNGRQKISEEPNYPRVLVDMSGEHFRKLADQYIADTAIHRKGAPRFVDKMPNNFLHIGLIHLMFPNAGIIDARRHPAACCFSGFKQLFADGQEFTYGLDELVRYYKSYVNLMKHWDTVLPGRVLRVHYEDVVADADQQVGRILEYLDLPFEKQCVQFHQTRRSVRTPSSEQVRQPIYSSALDHWRNYEQWLEPVLRGLEAEIAEYPYRGNSGDRATIP